MLWGVPAVAAIVAAVPPSSTGGLECGQTRRPQLPDAANDAPPEVVPAVACT